MNRLKELRERKGLSQRETARILGITQASYSFYESGKRQPDNDMLLRLSELFETTTDYLLGKDEQSGDDELNEYLEQLRTRPEMRMIFSLTSSATKEDVEKLVKMAEVMFGKN